jgi:hypothetical protein
MMSDSGYASLGPTLLARKGGAKPAMRPQLPALSDSAEVTKLADDQLEDLGWNDMGDEDDSAAEDAIRVVVPIDPATPFDPEAIAASPIVRRQQRRLEERVLADAIMIGPEDTEAEYGEPEDDGSDYEAEFAEHKDNFAPLHSEEPALVSVNAKAKGVLATRPAKQARSAPKVAAASARRAAFTLRLDTERHLKLRLAATMKGVSAQALVTDALDALLADFEDLDVIAAHLQRH